MGPCPELVSREAGEFRGFEGGPLLGTVYLRAVLTKDANCLKVVVILTQPDDEGHQHLVAYKSSKLIMVEWNYPAHILVLLAVALALRIFRHYLLGNSAPRADGCWSDIDLRTDNQAMAQDKQSSEQDVRLLTRPDRGLPIRSHAPARGQESDGSTVASQLRGL